MTEQPLFASEREEMDRLHWTILQTLNRLPIAEIPAHPLRPYQPAYLASRIQQLEILVGALLSLMLLKQPVNADDMFQMMGDLYSNQIQDLELNAAIHNTAFHLAPRVKKKFDQPVKEDKPDD